MIKNGKYFLPQVKDGSNFKELFKHLASAGVGRPVDQDGFPEGPWTPELLADAITKIGASGSGVDLRTVQLWFQDNDKGISPDNIRWLARIFGCDDPEATSEWQAKLSSAQAQLVAKRRESRTRAKNQAKDAPAIARNQTFANERTATASTETDNDAKGSKQRLSLARKSEVFFSRGSPLDLSTSVFAGAVALGFLSYFLGIHSISFSLADGPVKQVGFIWAPNWTILFMVLMPLFLGFVVEIVIFWKNEGRSKQLPEGGRAESDNGWTHSVEVSSYTYWAVLLICLGFAGLFQWIGVRLLPLIRGGGDVAPDWGSLAITHPDIISVPEAVAFTGLAYLYMSLCFYLFFVGLVLLFTVVYDFWKIGGVWKFQPAAGHHREVSEVGLRLMRGIFRCTILGVLISICMKLQTLYLSSNGENIVAWLLSDMSSVLYARDEVGDTINYSMPTHYSSLLIALATCFVFLYGYIRIGANSPFYLQLRLMSAIVLLLIASYLLINAFTGFSILLSIGVMLSTYGLYDPEFGARQNFQQGEGTSVS